ncbi:shugoshin [Drosophila guanche]|uniref:Blast:Shugoshin n=1 Tax=Drosophila guanche TaxID=7266 RepID=A0A3B0JBU5_DROGU|nr:shugoshin [Drosophila guanche]SPP72750.1 blast:Shugoshin [Drosophila guanche]
MSTKNVELQYKLLNAELMGHVQKLRVELGEYKKLVVNLQTELLDEREYRVLAMDTKKRQIKCALSALMKDLDLEEDNPASVNHTQQEELKSPTANRRSSIKEVCNEMRRFSDMTRPTRTCSPSSRRSSSSSNSTLRNSSSGVIAEDATEVNAATASPEATQTQTQYIYSAVTPPPRRIAEMALALDDSDEDSPCVVDEDSPCVVDEDSPCVVDEDSPCVDNAGLASLCFIIEETDYEFASDNSSNYSFPSMEICDVRDTPIRTRSARGQVLRELSENVPKESGAQVRGKPEPPALTISCHADDSSQEMSIQQQRHLPLSPMPMHVHMSVVSPRQSQFNGIISASGSTSTPHSSPAAVAKKNGTTKKKPHNDPQEETVSVSTARTRFQTSQETLSASHKSPQDDQSSCSGSGRPSRQCRPTSLKEPNLNRKMRNNSQSKKNST